MIKLCWGFSEYNYTNYDMSVGIQEGLESIIASVLSEEEVELELFDVGTKPHIFIYIGEAMDYVDKGSSFTHHLIEGMQEDAYNESEYAEGYLDMLTEEQYNYLASKLDVLWEDFKKFAEIKSPFYYVKNVKKYKVYIDGSYEEVEYEPK